MPREALFDISEQPVVRARLILRAIQWDGWEAAQNLGRRQKPSAWEAPRYREQVQCLA